MSLMVKVVVFFKATLVSFLIFSYAMAEEENKCILDYKIKPVPSYKEVYENLPKEGRPSMEVFLEAIEKLPKLPRWKSHDEEKFFFMSRSIDFVLYGRVLPYHENVWSSFSLVDVLTLKDVDLKLKVLEVYKKPKNSTLDEGEVINIGTLSGYLYVGEYGESVYQLRDGLREYLDDAAVKKEEIESGFESGVISYGERDLKFELLELKNGENKYRNFTFMPGRIEVGSAAGRKRLCGLPFIKGEGEYILFLKKHMNGGYEFSGAQSIFPSSFKKIAKEVFVKNK